MFVTDVLLDYGALCDELRAHSSEWLEDARREVLREQRRWHLCGLAITAVLDERGRLDDSTAVKDGTTTRSARRKRATARKLKAQPNVAKAAAQDKLSEEQLDKITDLADGDPEAEERWAREGAGWSPDDLAAELRRKRKPTVEDAAARGEAWDTREHRGADALVELCRAYADRDRDGPTSGTRANIVVHVPTHGPATVAGVPLPDQMVERSAPTPASSRCSPTTVKRASSGVPRASCRRRRSGW